MYPIPKMDKQQKKKIVRRKKASTSKSPKVKRAVSPRSKSKSPKRAARTIEYRVDNFDIPAGPFVRMARSVGIDRSAKSFIDDAKVVFLYHIRDVVDHLVKIDNMKTVTRGVMRDAVMHLFKKTAHAGAEIDKACKSYSPPAGTPRKSLKEREVAHYGKEAGKGCLFFPKSLFAKIVRHYVHAQGGKHRFSKDGMDLFQTVIEDKLRSYFEDSLLAAIHAKRQVVTWKDLYLVQALHNRGKRAYSYHAPSEFSA